MFKRTKRVAAAVAVTAAITSAGLISAGGSASAAVVWVCVYQGGISMCTNGAMIFIEPY